MIVIYSSFTVDPSQRGQLEMAAFLAGTADQTTGARIYQYRADPDKSGQCVRLPNTAGRQRFRRLVAAAGLHRVPRQGASERDDH